MEEWIGQTTNCTNRDGSCSLTVRRGSLLDAVRSVAYASTRMRECLEMRLLPSANGGAGGHVCPGILDGDGLGERLVGIIDGYDLVCSIRTLLSVTWRPDLCRRTETKVL